MKKYENPVLGTISSKLILTPKLDFCVKTLVSFNTAKIENKQNITVRVTNVPILFQIPFLQRIFNVQNI